MKGWCLHFRVKCSSYSRKFISECAIPITCRRKYVHWEAIYTLDYIIDTSDILNISHFFLTNQIIDRETVFTSICCCSRKLSISHCTTWTRKTSIICSPSSTWDIRSDKFSRFSHLPGLNNTWSRKDSLDLPEFIISAFKSWQIPIWSLYNFPFDGCSNTWAFNPLCFCKTSKNPLAHLRHTLKYIALRR